MKEHRKDGVQWVTARLKPEQNFKRGSNKPQPKLDCWFSLQHLHILSSPSYLCYLYGKMCIICASSSWGCRGGVRWPAVGSGWVRAACSTPNLPAKLPTQTLPFTTSSSSAATAASRDFNELATILQPTYLPPAPHTSLCRSLPLPALFLAAPRQRGEGERNYLLCAC